MNYGLAIIFTSWIPLIVVILHIGFSRETNIFKYCRHLPGIIGLALSVIIFPVIPTMMYALLMLTSRQSAKDRRRYKKLERQAHEIKSICGSIEAPIQLGMGTIHLCTSISKTESFVYQLDPLVLF